MMEHTIWNLWRFSSQEMFSFLERNQRFSVVISVELQLRGLTTWIDIFSANMMQHTKMRRLYLRESSALIPTLTKNISIKANALSTSQKNITLISKLLKKTLQICRSFFHGKKKKKVKTFYTLVNSAVLAIAELQATCIMFVNIIVTVKLIVEKKNLTKKRIKDIIIEELRETHFVKLKGTWNFMKVTGWYQ